MNEQEMTRIDAENSIERFFRHHNRVVSVPVTGFPVLNKALLFAGMINTETDMMNREIVSDRKMARMTMRRRRKAAAEKTSTGILSLLTYNRENGGELVDVQVEIPDLNVVAFTNEEAELYVDKVSPGTYIGNLVRDKFRSLPFTFDIEPGRTTTLQLLMDRI